MSDEIPGYAIAKLSLAPGDILVVKCNLILTAKQIYDVRSRLQSIVGDIPALVISSDIDLAVLTRSEIESRVESSRSAPERIIDLPES